MGLVQYVIFVFFVDFLLPFGCLGKCEVLWVGFGCIFGVNACFRFGLEVGFVVGLFSY